MTIKTIARRLFRAGQAAVGSGSRLAGLQLIAPNASEAEIAEVRRRAAFFFSPRQADAMTVHRRLSAARFIDASPILTFGVEQPVTGAMAGLHQGVFDIDWRRNPLEGWNWIYATNWAAAYSPSLFAARQRFRLWVERLGALGFERCYVFGTGPSLASAVQRDWSDGLRLVCNTIVRDADLWRHIDPHAIVAGDGIYHFGFTEFAQAFRRDLRTRLEETRNVLFVYPAEFDQIVRRELGQLEEQLVPVPVGKIRHFHGTLLDDFLLPDFDNALSLLLLPLACALSRQVLLWGFDGRAPADKLFWSNSSQQSYPELMHHLRTAHPAFFEANVPDKDPTKYFRNAMGEKLERGLMESEEAGWRFEILHESWTDSLRRRSAWRDHTP